MNASNRRRARRLKIERSVKVSVQIFPVMPFIGDSVQAGLINISNGGMALVVEDNHGAKISRGTKIRLHFRLPGGPLRECRAVITHFFSNGEGKDAVGIRFQRPPVALMLHIDKMVDEWRACEDRIQSQRPWCDPACSYHSLCRKPIRETESPYLELGRVEFALQPID